MNDFLYHKPCPECRRRGNDISGNNLGVWADGHCYCFNCGYSVGSSAYNRIKSISSGDTQIRAEPDKHTVVLPDDVDSYIPAVARLWVGQYGLTEYEIIAHKLLWSEKYQRLIFPYFDIYSNLLGWQGRYFGKDDRPKWFSQGDLKKIYHILPFRQEYGTIVVVEDVVSAIKLSRYIAAMPLFGNEVSVERIIRLSKLSKGMAIWLDPDMRRKTIVGAARAKQIGFPCELVFSDKDPKEHSKEEILDRIGKLC